MEFLLFLKLLIHYLALAVFFIFFVVRRVLSFPGTTNFPWTVPGNWMKITKLVLDLMMHESDKGLERWEEDSCI